MKGYSIPKVVILYLSSDDVMQNSKIKGDPAETMPSFWEEEILGGETNS